MHLVFSLIRLPVAVVGAILYTLVLPVAWVFHGVWLLGSNVLRVLGVPFVVLGAALIEQSLWTDYLRSWPQSNREISKSMSEWGIDKYADLLTWVTTGK